MSYQANVLYGLNGVAVPAATQLPRDNTGADCPDGCFDMVNAILLLMYKYFQLAANG